MRVTANTEQTIEAPMRLNDCTRAASSDSSAARPILFNGLLTNRLLIDLPGPDFARMLPHLQPIMLVQGQEVFGANESVEYVYFPESAVVSHLIVMGKGVATATTLIGRDGLVGLNAVFGSRTRFDTDLVAVGGTALRMDATVLGREFSRSSSIQEVLLRYLHSCFVHVSQRAICNLYHKINQRLSAWLLMMHDRTADDDLPITSDNLSLQLGVSHVAVTTAFKTLRDVIDCYRGGIRILDRPRLEAAACECYRTLSYSGPQPAIRNVPEWQTSS